LLPRKKKRLPWEPFLWIVSDSFSGAARRTGAKTPKEGRKRTAMTIVPRCFRLKRQTRSKCCLLCRWKFLVHRPSSAARGAGHYCVQAERKRYESREEPQEYAAV
jgi:hypothetical protein